MCVTCGGGFDELVPPQQASCERCGPRRREPTCYGDSVCGACACLSNSMSNVCVRGERRVSCVCTGAFFVALELAKADTKAIVRRRDRVQQMAGWRIVSVPGTLTSTLSSESVRRVNPIRVRHPPRLLTVGGPVRGARGAPFHRNNSSFISFINTIVCRCK